MAKARRDAHARVAGARRQGPDDRARRRRPRARRQRRRLLLDAQRRPDVHLDRARLRRGAGLRRVRRQGHREGARAAPGRARPARARSTSARSRSRRRSTSSSATSRTPSTKGARVLVGGQRGRGRDGHCYEPTVLVDVDHTMECMREETFGPTLPIMKVARRRGGACGWPTTRRTASAPRCSPRTSRAARRSRAASRPAPSASTTRCVNYTALELPMGGVEGLRPRLAPRRRAASASTPSSRRCSCRGCTPQEGPAHVSRTPRR